MANSSINFDLNDPRSGKIAEALSNKTAKKILHLLSEGELSGSEIAERLGAPLNTISYNLNKLVDAGLVERAKKFFWSSKGKRMEIYKLANKKIVISPRILTGRVIAPVLGVLLALIVILALINLPRESDVGRTEPIIFDREFEGLKKFGSEQELRDFVKNSLSGQGEGVYGLDSFARAGGPVPSVASGAAAESGGGKSAGEFSGTNIQVEGVDEADIVKNDGKYIYTVSGNKVVIVDAFPAGEMEIVSELEFEDYVSNIFINNDKLVVFSAHYEYIDTGRECLYADGGEMARSILPPYPCGGYSKQNTIVYIYDVSNRAEPELENKIEMDGNYVQARMIGDYVYLITSKYIQLNVLGLPRYSVDGVESVISPGDVYYFDYIDGKNFNIVNAINLQNGEVKSKAYLIDYSTGIYVSEDNIYITHMKSINQEDYLKRTAEEVYFVVLPFAERVKVENVLSSDKKIYEKNGEISEIINDYMISLEGEELYLFNQEFENALYEFSVKMQKETEKTVVHKIHVDEDEIEYEAMGEVPGSILNQFSMDEYKDNFRIATTTSGSWRERRAANSLNHLYVLDEDLKVIGKVEDLAKGERIYSVRFLGDRAYMVTFRQVDPLFVIDLSSPKNPEVLGYLKVTGFSNYLHPYDENHIIGVGQEATPEGRALGVKIAIFDVTDVANPVELSKYEVKEGEWSHSEALYEHKAFLFDKEKELLVIPVSYNKRIDVVNEAYGYYRYEYWQGAFVFNVNLEEGIKLKGKIAHELESNDNYYWQRQGYVRRALYMDDFLYTISDRKIKANDLNDLSEVSFVSLPYKDYPVVVYGDGGGVAVSEPAVDA